MKDFTRALYELFVKQEMGLSQSLLIMSRKPKQDKVSRAARSIYSSLEKGNLFSNALRTCGTLAFDDLYISFVRLAEKNGDLKSAVSYLKNKLEREAEIRKRLFGASIYPAFVVLLSVGASIFIGIYTKSADFELLAKYLAGFLLICGVMFFAILKTLGEDRLCEAFRAVDFLLQSGIELSEAVECAVQVVGPFCRIGRLFENAKKRLSYGMDLQSAFSDFPEGNGNYAARLREAFYYADTGGSKNDLFGRIALHLESEKEKSRTFCLVLIEPLFIVITGGFLLMLLMSFFMPLINDISWI